MLGRLDEGVDMAFITIGDPAFYDTFFYLYERLISANPGLRIEIIPGVSSINASASRARIPLGLGAGADRHPARGEPRLLERRARTVRHGGADEGPQGLRPHHCDAGR